MQQSASTSFHIQRPMLTDMKPAISMLNEIKPGLQYHVVSQHGPVHLPEFQVAVHMDGRTYTGKGPSKQLAKHAAAQSALLSVLKQKSMLRCKNYNREGFKSVGATSSISCSDKVERAIKSQGTISSISCLDKVERKEKIKSDKSPAIDLVSKAKTMQTDGKNPVMLLNELNASVVYKISGEQGEAHAKQFTMTVTIGDQVFEGIGSSKKLAKDMAARKALVSLFGIQCHTENQTRMDSMDPSITKLLVIPQVLVDRIAWLVQKKFSELTKEQPQATRHKMLAGIVMTTGPDVNDAHVICVSTGTKCISGEHMSFDGYVVNDCHAEIISRRCLVDFLYSQLEEYSEGKGRANNSIFVTTSTSNGQYRFKLRDNFKFHLYISSAPCGDARVFSPHDADLKLTDIHPQRKSRGQLRTKIESGEGTIPVNPNGTTQTWDSILAGQRLLTMSCSDKIAKWNVLGIQGTLLSKFMEPIYLDSIVLGGLFHAEHLHRAVAGRISDFLYRLPPSFRHNKPMLGCSSTIEPRLPAKAPTTSINWTVGQKMYEVINATSGKTENNSVSRLAKRNFLSRYLKLCGSGHSTPEMHRYIDIKKACCMYNFAKLELKRAFTRAELGSWVNKPDEEGQFEVLANPLLVKGNTNFM